MRAMAALAGRSWAEFARVMHEHALLPGSTAQTFVPVASCDAGHTVPVFPVLRAQWAARYRVPRLPRHCTAYVDQAIALLDRHWPLEWGDVPDPKGACDAALRFVIYFAERDIAPEREHEFLLAVPLHQLVKTLVDKAASYKPKQDLSFGYVREVVAKRMQEIGARQPFVLREVVRALQRTEPEPKTSLRLHLLLHDADHVLSACDRALVPLHVLTTGRTHGTGFRETTVRVAWPGLLEANGRLHMPFSDKPWYAAPSESIMPLVRPSTARAGDSGSERAKAACFNIASFEAVCHTDDLMRDASAHRAPPLHLVALPAPRLLIDDILSGILPSSPRADGFMLEEEFDFGKV